MTAYTYSRVAALNFNTTPPTMARSATGSVYAIADTTFTTPLTLTMVVGGSTTTTVSSDALGFFPDFTVDDRTSAVWKQTGVAFTTVITTSDPVPGATGAPGADGATGEKGDRGDLATWQATTFYPLNQAIVNPTGDIVKVITAHTSTGSYDATKFTYANNTVVDAQTASFVGNGATATGAALNATFVPKWKATTAYLAGDAVLSPAGDTITAIANFTSGASYNAANWNLSTSYTTPAQAAGLSAALSICLGG